VQVEVGLSSEMKKEGRSNCVESAKTKMHSSSVWRTPGHHIIIINIINMNDRSLTILLSCIGFLLSLIGIAITIYLEWDKLATLLRRVPPPSEGSGEDGGLLSIINLYG
jgi:hypothetical protein